MDEKKRRVCYAIMPYGGKDPALKGRFKLVYQLFMLIPAREKGLKVEREDFDPQTGMITRSIVQHLAQDELVIADLSNANWNVAYELGIRHSLIKGRTVLICDKNTDLRFDIRGFPVIRYNGENLYDNIDAIQKEIGDAIDQRLQSSGKPDNIVHEVLNFPYENLTDCLNPVGSEAEELQQIRGKLATLQSENEKLRQKLPVSESNLDSSADETEIISKKIDAAFKSVAYSGHVIILELRSLVSAEKPDYDEIQRILKLALNEGYLSEADFRQMFFIFREFGMPQLTNLVLETAAERYPASLDFKSYLADAYSDTYNTRDKAIELADQVLQISIVNNKRISKCRKIDRDQLAACLNAYIGAARYDIMAEIIPSLMEHLPTHKETLLRNLSVAYRELGDSEKEKQTLTQLLAEFPMNDINQYCVYKYYRQANSDIQAYYHLLLASALDVDDPDYPFALAGLIFDEHFYVNEKGGVTQLHGREEYAKVALPFLMRAVQAKPTSQFVQKCYDFILRNKIPSYLKPFEEWINSQLPDDGIPGLNNEGVNYLVKVLDEINEELCSQMYFENGLASFM